MNSNNLTSEMVEVLKKMDALPGCFMRATRNMEGDKMFRLLDAKVNPVRNVSVSITRLLSEMGYIFGGIHEGQGIACFFRSEKKIPIEFTGIREGSN